VFRECLFHNNVTDSYGSGTVFVEESANVKVKNCTFSDNSSSGGGTITATDNSFVSVEASILAFDHQGQAVYCDTSSCTDVLCSDFYSNAAGDWVGCVSEQGTINSNFSKDPLFCNRDSLVYYLTPFSPCVYLTECGLIGALGVGCAGIQEIDVQPDSLNFVVYGSDLICDTLVISNLGSGSLSWLVGEDTNSGIARKVGRLAVVAHQSTGKPRAKGKTCSPRHVELGKGEADLRKGKPVVSSSGGPDAYGYTWIDSDDPEGPSFVWQDISGCGTELSLGDDDSAEIALPFVFPFYQSAKSSMKISSNGYLTFGADPTDYSNDDIPDVTEPNDFIAPFWDDLDPELGGAIHCHYDSSSNQFIVQYSNIQRYVGEGTYTFQVVLDPDRSIMFHYLNVDGEIEGATIGIERDDGTSGLKLAFNASYVHDSLTVLIQDALPWISEDPIAGIIEGADSQTLAICVDASSLEPGVYVGNLIVDSNDPDEEQTVIPVTLTAYPTGIIDVEVRPAEFALHGNFPNPFNPSTVIKYETPIRGEVSLSVFSVTGQLVRVLVDETKNPGRHRAVWDGRNDEGQPVSSGVYFYRLKADGFESVSKMLLLK
jgi:hypothetical protein